MRHCSGSEQPATRMHGLVEMLKNIDRGSAGFNFGRELWGPKDMAWRTKDYGTLGAGFEVCRSIDQTLSDLRRWALEVEYASMVRVN